MCPPTTCRCFPSSFPTIGFEHVVGVHICHEVFHFVGLGEFDPMVLSFDLAPVYLAGEGYDVGVGCLYPGLKELRLDGEFFLRRDDVPRLELLEHCPDVLVLVLVINVVLL